MKNKALIFVTLILISCGDLVRFEVPQPEGQSDEKGISKRLRGRYASLDDSSRLVITGAFIIKYSRSYVTGKIDSLDMEEIKGDTAYSGGDNKLKFDVVIKGDSTFQHWSLYDTIFDASRGDILRKYKGHYFLNEQLSTNSWRVTTLSRVHKGVTLGSISKKADIDNLRALTETKSDTVFSFRPTKKQLKKFLKDKGFDDKDTFIKIE